MSVPSPRHQSSEAGKGRGSGSATNGGQLSRLLQLVLALQSDSFPNARELARSCEVSRRTIYRDLDALASAGIIVRYRSDHQGYQLARSCPVPTPSLEDPEAFALLALTRQWERDDSFGLLRDAKAGVIKVLQGLPWETRNRVIDRAEVVPDRPIPHDVLADRMDIHDAIRNSLIDRRQIRICYLESDGRSVESTKFSVYRLVQLKGMWCLVGRSSLHRGVRTIRVGSVRQVEVTQDPAVIPPRFSLERHLGQAWAIDRGAERFAIHLRFAVAVAPQIRETVRHRGRRFEACEDGRVDLHVVVDGLEELTGWILGFGRHVEVISPSELGERVREEALKVARLHGYVG